MVDEPFDSKRLFLSVVKFHKYNIFIMEHIFLNNYDLNIKKFAIIFCHFAISTNIFFDHRPFGGGFPESIFRLWSTTVSE